MSEALFLGDQLACRAFLQNRRLHYVYVLRRPDGRPFYVGKGYGDRVFQHENEARHPNDRRSNCYKLNVIRSIWRACHKVSYEIEYLTDDPERAYLREAELISRFKRLHEGGTLTNLDPGGGSAAGPAPESVQKHSATLAGAPHDNPDRAVLNKFFLAITAMASLPIKPVDQFTPRPTQPYPRKSISPTSRQAAALLASAAANGIVLDDDCNIPRRITIEHVTGLVENGVSCDIVTSGLAAVVPASYPADELFKLTGEQARRVVNLVGRKTCTDLGVVTLNFRFGPD